MSATSPGSAAPRRVPARHCAGSSRARTPRSISTCACSAPGPTAITSCARCSRRSSCTTRSTAQEKPGPFALKCRTPGVPLDESNLVWRAAAALWKALGRAGDPPTRVVTIEKAHSARRRASAAAAPTRRRRCWCSRGCGAARRSRCCARSRPAIGSDVPFFLSGGTALGLGRGEEIYPLVDLPRHWVVVVRPPFGVSTAEAYCLVRRGPRRRGARAARRAADSAGAVAERAAQMINDLEPPVMRRHPEIGTIKAALREAGPSPRRCPAAARPSSACSAPARPRRGRSVRSSRAGARPCSEPDAVPRRARARARPIARRV